MERSFEKLKRNYHIQVEGNEELLGISYGEVAIAQGGTNNPRGAVCAERGFQDYVPVEHYFGLPIEEKYGGKIYAIVDDKVYISRDDEDIILYYKNNQFQYQLPFTINLEKTKKELGKKIQIENSEKIELEKIAINKNGLIEGHNFKDYDEALFEFMDILHKIRRNI